jgi:hypothetical protein
MKHSLFYHPISFCRTDKSVTLSAGCEFTLQQPESKPLQSGAVVEY